MSQKERKKKEIAGGAASSLDAASDAGLERTERLVELALTLAGEPVEVFKKIAGVLRDLFDVPLICLTSIEGGRCSPQSLCVDAGVSLSHGQCSFESTPCTKVLEDKEIRIFHNASGKFSEVHFLTENNIDTYCGIPSLDASGNVVAVICLLDHRERHFTEEDKKIFSFFAKRIGLEIERQRAIDEGESLTESLALFKNLIDQSNDAMFVAEPSTGRLIEVNRKAAADLGYTRKELLDLRVQDIEKSVRSDALWREHVRLVKEKGAIMVEGERKRKDGTCFLVEVSVKHVVLDSNDYLLTVARDITVEEEQREREERYRALIEAIPHGIQENDVDGMITFSNRGHSKILGFEEGELVGTYIWDQHTSEESKEKLKRYLKVLVKEEPKPVPYQTKALTRSGVEIVIQVDWDYKRDADGNVKGFTSVITDITERTRAEEALKKSEEKYRTLLENLPQKIFLKDKNSVYISCSENLANDLKVSPDEIAGKTDYDFFSKELADKYRTDDKKIIETGITEDIVEKTVLDGKESIIHTVKTPVKDETGEVTGILGIFWDITEQKRAEDSLIVERERFNSLLNSLPVMVYLQAPDHTIRFASKNFTDKYGEPGSRPCYEVIWDRQEPCEQCMTFKVFDTGVPEIWESEHEDGTAYKVYDYPFTDVDGSPLVLEVSIDITELKRTEREREDMQAQLMHAQKMEAVGTLASGIAHDFNNIMTVVKTLTGLALARLEPGDEMERYLKPVSDSANRAIGLVQQLLLFSQKKPVLPVELNLNDTTTELLSMLEHLISDDIAIDTGFSSDLWNVESDPGRMDQLITNLVVNSSDAMPKGGEILIRTENVTLAKCDCVKSVGAYPGKFVRLTINDNGIGMNDKVREHIFEPFYTTKEQGTGMGLAVVYGIVKESKGWIEVESKLHCGTTFTIYLPAVDEGFEEEAVRGEEPARGVGSGRRILLVEDEKWVRKSTAMLLAAYGYEVTEARDAERALALFYREKGRYDLVLSDVVLPGRSGLELVNPLLDVNPCISILLCSSHLDAKSQFEQIIKRGLPFIQKPFEIPELIRAIEETIVQAKA